MGLFKKLFLGGETDKRLGIVKEVIGTGIAVLGTIAGAAISGHILKKQLGEEEAVESLPEESEAEASEETGEVENAPEEETEETK